MEWFGLWTKGCKKEGTMLESKHRSAQAMPSSTLLLLWCKCIYPCDEKKSWEKRKHLLWGLVRAT